MTSLNVALVQARSRGVDPELALRDGERLCREAAAQGADVVLFPELWQLGYTSWRAEPAQRAAWLAHATTLDGPFVSHFRELARELDIAIVITYLEAWPGAPRNTATLIDRHGEPVLTYAKVHTCDFGMEAALTPGDGFRVADLDTRAGTVRVGLMICYDREFPESARVLMLGGAELILTPNACGLDADRLGQFRARAYENMVGVAMANYATPDPADDLGHLEPLDVCNGHSVAFSGIKFDRAGNALDHKLVEAGEGEELPIATFDLDALRAYRAYEAGGDAYRYRNCVIRGNGAQRVGLMWMEGRWTRPPPRRDHRAGRALGGRPALLIAETYPERTTLLATRSPTPLKRIVLSVVAAGVLVIAGLTLVGAAPASAKYRVGVGEQKAAMFESPAWQSLKLKRVRYLVPWDYAKHARPA